MSPDLKPATFRLERDLLEQLQRIKERDGIPVSEQVRRALKAWIQGRGTEKAERKRVAPRKRS